MREWVARATRRSGGFDVENARFANLVLDLPNDGLSQTRPSRAIGAWHPDQR